MTKEQRLQRNAADLRAVMSLVSGRRFVAQILMVSNFFETKCEPGARALGAAIWKDLEAHCPEDLIKMLGEKYADEPIEKDGEPEPDFS